MSAPFGHLSGWKGIRYPKKITLKRGVVNTHGHGRDIIEDGDGRANLIFPLFQGIFDHYLSIGNTGTPLTTTERAFSQKKKWRALSPWTHTHVIGILTEMSQPEEIIAGYDLPDGEEAWVAMKMFLRAVSNAHGADVNDVSKVIACIKAMTYTKWRHKKKPMRLKIHCERKETVLGMQVELMDREWTAFMRDIEYILKEVPDAEIEICHMSDGRTVEAIRALRRKGYNIFGEVSPHYTQYTLESLFEDGSGGTGMNAHGFCVPIFKRPGDRAIIGGAMTSNEPYFHFGDDGACHHNDPTKPKGVKITSGGVVIGGQTQIPEATISYVVERFVETGRLRYLSDFLGGRARKSYGLSSYEPRPITLVREDWTVPDTIEDTFEGKLISCVVAARGEPRKYRVLRA